MIRNASEDIFGGPGTRTMSSPPNEDKIHNATDVDKNQPRNEGTHDSRTTDPPPPTARTNAAQC